MRIRFFSTANTVRFMEDGPFESIDNQAIAEAIAYQNAIDIDAAGPKAPHGAIPYKGVVIDSRWNVLAEFRSMRSIVDELSELMRARIASIWCDSNCTANYIVTVKPGKFAVDLPDAVEAAIVTVCGGHNGIMIESDAVGGDVILDCNWCEGPEV